MVFYSLDEEFAQISWWPVVDNYRAALRTSFNNVSPADEQYLCRTKWNGFNLNFPNNSSLCSLADQKIFCGSLNNTDTSTVCLTPLSYSLFLQFESEHKERRQKMTSTNGKSLTRDVIKIVCTHLGTTHNTLTYFRLTQSKPPNIFKNLQIPQQKKHIIHCIPNCLNLSLNRPMYVALPFLPEC